jgi:hypothetical protein
LVRDTWSGLQIGAFGMVFFAGVVAKLTVAIFGGNVYECLSQECLYLHTLAHEQIADDKIP